MKLCRKKGTGKKGTVKKYFYSVESIEKVRNASKTHLNTIGGGWYFWKGIWASKAHEPGTLSGNATFTKV